MVTSSAQVLDTGSNTVSANFLCSFKLTERLFEITFDFSLSICPICHRSQKDHPLGTRKSYFMRLIGIVIKLIFRPIDRIFSPFFIHDFQVFIFLHYAISILLFNNWWISNPFDIVAMSAQFSRVFTLFQSKTFSVMQITTKWVIKNIIEYLY